MSPLEQLIMKKMQEGKQMSPLEQKAKMSNLDSLKDEMHSMMKGHLGDSDGAKVEIASDSPEGLKMGLDKAQDVLGSDDDSSEDSSDEDASDQDDADDDHAPAAGLIEQQIEHEDSEGELSPDEIDQLQMLLAKLKAKKA